MKEFTRIAREIKKKLSEPYSEIRTVSVFMDTNTNKLYADFNKFEGIHIYTLNKENLILLCSYQSNMPLDKIYMIGNKCILNERIIASHALLQMRRIQKMLLNTKNYRFPTWLLDEIHNFKYKQI